MGLFDWLWDQRKPLSQMDRHELRKQELLLEKEREQLLSRVTDLARKKQEIFERGAKERTNEVRRALAEEFETHTAEQLLLTRQLNIRSKEALTVSRFRMLRENAERARGSGSRLGLVSEKDLLTLEKLITSEAVTTEMYRERLESMLSQDAREREAGLSKTGQEVLDVWEQVDRGVILNPSEAYDEADRRVRDRQRSAEGG